MEIINRQRAEKRRRIYAAIAVVASLALLVGLCFVLAAITPDVSVPGADMALKPTVVGGYLLTGAICFALGVGVALICLWKRKNESASQESGDEER